jgi:uncharacterized protein (DUF1499 family)
MTQRRIEPCPNLPNCVSSQASTHDVLHRIEPLRFATDRATLMAAVLIAIRRRSGLRVLERDDEYVHAVARSAILRLPSDVELLVDMSAGLLHVRASSRYGRSDLGANRRRAEELLAAVEDELRR